MRKIRTKLTSVDVADIRRDYELGATQRELCLRHRMSIGQIGRIVRGESWTKVQAMPSEDEMEAMANRVAAAQRNLQAGGQRVEEPQAMPTLPRVDIPVPQSVADRAAAFGAHVLPPVSALEGGDQPDETGGVGIHRLFTTKGDEDGK